MKTIFEELKRQKSQHYEGRLDEASRKQFELAACGMLSIGRIDDAMEIFATINVDPPAHLLIVCGDRLLATGHYQKAFAAYVDSKDHAALKAFGDRCETDKQYDWAFKAYENVHATEELHALGILCLKSKSSDTLAVALSCLKATGDTNALPLVGFKCMQAKNKLKTLPIALDAFTACGARNQLEHLGVLAMKEWEASPEENLHLGYVAKDAFHRADAKHRMVRLGEKAMSVNTDLAFHTFSEAGAMHKLIELGDAYSAQDKLDSAAKCFALASDEDRLFLCAKKMVEVSDAHNAFCRVYSAQKIKPPFAKFEALAATYLEKGDEEKAWEIYFEISCREPSRRKPDPDSSDE